MFVGQNDSSAPLCDENPGRRTLTHSHTESWAHMKQSLRVYCNEIRSSGYGKPGFSDSDVPGNVESIKMEINAGNMRKHWVFISVEFRPKRLEAGCFFFFCELEPSICSG